MSPSFLKGEKMTILILRSVILRKILVCKNALLKIHHKSNQSCSLSISAIIKIKMGNYTLNVTAPATLEIN